MKHRPYSIRSMHAVDRELRKHFPKDAGHRCMYGAFALAHLLRDASFEATVVGGDFTIFIPSRDGSSAAFHGFGGSTEPGTTSHYWVQSEGRIIDPSTLLLHTTTRQNIVQLPIVYWPMLVNLPRYIRYEVKMKASADAEFSTIAEQCEAAAAILQSCRRRMSTGSLVTARKIDVLDGPNLVFHLAKKNAWAKAAAEYETNMHYGTPPF